MAKSGAVDTGLFDLAGRGVSWWLDELRALAPSRFKKRAKSRAAAIDCVLLPDGRIAAAFARAGALPDVGDAAEIGLPLAARLGELEASARRRTARLSVPRDLCLIRRSRLPSRALAHAGTILRHEAEALLPFAPGDILADWYVETEDTAAREIHLVQVVLARPRIRQAEEAIAAAGFELVAVTVGDAEKRPIPVDLLFAREPSLRAALLALPLSAKLLSGAALALLLLAPWIAGNRQEAALDRIAEERAATARPSPVALSAVAVADFLDAEARRPPLAALLDEVARRLPRGTVLTHLDLDGERLRLGLGGAQAGAVAAAFEGSTLLETEPGAAEASNIVTLRLRAPLERHANGDAP